MRRICILGVLQDRDAAVWVVGSEKPVKAEEVERRDGMCAIYRKTFETLIRDCHCDTEKTGEDRQDWIDSRLRNDESVSGCHGQTRNILSLGQPCRHLSKIYGNDYSRQQYLKAQERLLVGEIESKACHPMFARKLLIQLPPVSMEEVAWDQIILFNKIFLGQVN